MGDRIHSDVFMHLLRVPAPSEAQFRWHATLRVVCRDWHAAVRDVRRDAYWLQPFAAASGVCADRLHQISTLRTALGPGDVAFVADSMACFRAVEDVQLDACYLLARLGNPGEARAHLHAALVLTALRTYNASPSWKHLTADFACGALRVLCEGGLVEGPVAAESIVQVRGLLARRHIEYAQSRVVIGLLTAMRSDELLAAMAQPGLVAGVVPHMEC